MGRSSHTAPACMRAMDRLNCWHEAFASLITGPHAGEVSGEALLGFWTTYGPHIAESMQADPILPGALRALLPKYAGPGAVLYRGEDAERYRRRVIGMSWTPRLETARMFAHRREPRGVVLRLEASATAILCAPTYHSRYLGEDEYLIDTSAIGEPELLE